MLVFFLRNENVRNGIRNVNAGEKKTFQIMQTVRTDFHMIQMLHEELYCMSLPQC